MMSSLRSAAPLKAWMPMSNVPAVAGPGDDVDVRVAEHVQAGLDARGGRSGGLEGAVVDRDAHAGIGERPVDDGPAAGRDAEDRLRPEGLQGRRRARLAPQPWQARLPDPTSSS